MTELVLTPTAMAAGGAAVARGADGRVVFVDGALPGETVRAVVTDERKDFARATAVAILEPSCDRVAPPCPALAAGCGGCPWQHVSPGGQRRLKADIVADALRRIAKLADPPTPTVVSLDGPAVLSLAGPALRTTARLAVSAAGRAGHRPRRGAGAVETDTCMVAHPLLEELIVDGRYPRAHEVLLRVGVASGERLARTDAGPTAGVLVPAGTQVAGAGDGRLLAVHEEVGGRRFRVGADAFFQPGPAAAEALVQAVAAAAEGALRRGGTVVDLYAGGGLFASVLGAAHGLRVTAVERHAPALADARVNLADIDARVVASDVGRWRPKPDAAPPDLVVADPSRTGLGRPGAATAVAVGAPRLILVSCDPASLGRDTLLLTQAGYRLSSVALVDAFPHTFHIETVSRFDR